MDKFPTYTGDRPQRQGRFVNMEKQRIEDWTHSSLRAAEPDPLFITFEQLGENPEANFERWLRELTAEAGGGSFR